MIALAVILAVIIVIALLRFGVYAEYSEDGIIVKARVGPVSALVFPQKAKRKKAEERKKAKKMKKSKKAKESEDKAPGGLRGFLDFMPPVQNALGRVRRRLLIKNLTIRFVSANEDPAKAAMAFGMANAASGAVMPALEKVFRIKRRDLRFSADFEAVQPRIYIKAVISIALWEAVYIALALLPVLFKMAKKTTGKTVRKDGQKDGETSDK